MADRSLPVALGLGGLASIFIISGIQGKSLGDVLKGDLGESPNPSYSGNGSEQQTTPSQDAVGAEPGKPESQTRYPGQNASNPLVVGHNAVDKVRSESKLRDLKSKLESALGYKQSLENKVSRGELTHTQAGKLFQEKYPYYTRWFNEAKALT